MNQPNGSMPIDEPAASQPPAPDYAEPELEAPKPESFLPPEPLGQESAEPVHQAQEEHQPVEGIPPPADAAPDSAETNPPVAGPDQPHQF